MDNSTGTAEASRELELWGGAECTIVRVGDERRDQSVETGHRIRRDDIETIASLGVTTVRFPILWESIAPHSLDELDFRWTDDRLEMLRERGIKVIGGLLHHGSGPRYTSLIDPDFPAKFGDYAARVAERYPWIETWTPVNEPLTTARFSGLYGHWYPHHRSERSFQRALVNQCLGTLQAMRAIRAVNPDAKLLQTEDLGKTFSTAPLRHQAAWDNGRRWLSFDLLAGKVDTRHRWRRILRKYGIPEAELELLESGEARPDMIGINHYLTSDRFLDHRLELYPELPIGGNGRQRYVDAEAVRIRRLHLDTGILPRLREAWARYRTPMAITEVHHGCTRDEQLRWFAEVWRAAQTARGEGIMLRAVTLWAMFGNVDWRSLLTREDFEYDCGVFDVRGGLPRPTAIAKAAVSYAKGEDFDHPALDMPGWWRRPARLYPWHGHCKTLEEASGSKRGRRLLITGATGTLGQAFARIAEHRGLPFCLTSRADLDICNADSVRAAIEAHRPWAVINTAGFVRVADAEAEPVACHSANALGAELLARACGEAEIPLVTFSSDLVFDGQLGRPYSEDDATAPGCVYGESKARAEKAVLATWERSLVIRTAAFFGPWDVHNFAHHCLASFARGEPVRASRNEVVSPTYVPDLVHAALDLLIDGESGIWHLANKGAMSWHDFALRLAAGAGYDPGLVIGVDGPASNTALTSRRGMLLRPVEVAIEAFLDETGARMAEEMERVAAE